MKVNPLARYAAPALLGLGLLVSTLAGCRAVSTQAGSRAVTTAPLLPLVQHVDPMIGTDENPITRFGFAWDSGNVFPGSFTPQGMIAWSPDTTHAHKIAGGYWYIDREIQGFSLTHFSGRGVPCLKDIPFMPTILPVKKSPASDWMSYAAYFSHGDEQASPGFYRVKFTNGIQTSLTTTPRSGSAEFKFPEGTPASMLIKTDTSVTVKGNEVFGYRKNTISGKKRSYTLYFSAVFDQPFKQVKTWTGDKINKEAEANGPECGAIIEFDLGAERTVNARVGISYVSVENARENLATENPTWDFAGVRTKAESAWNATLNGIQVEGGTADEKKVFYTALYHSFVHPNIINDVNGEYPGMDEKVHKVAAGRNQYQNFPAWDQYRSHATLMAILKPKVSSDMMQSLVNYAQQDAGVRPVEGGGLPRWQQANRNSGGMVGDGVPVMIATAHAFGAKDFDTKGALEAMEKGASQPGTTSDGFKVRDGLEEYLKIGYVPNAVSITLEYCHSDFSIGQFAKALGEKEKFVTYQTRAQNWKNLWHEPTGLLQPRNADGSWDVGVKLGSVSDMHQPFVEASAEQTVWMINHDLHDLTSLMGGPKATIERLDRFFSNINAGMREPHAYMGNELCVGIPWVYAYAGAPARTQELTRRIQRELFTTKPSGIPGNDDAGSISSYHVFSALGMFPTVPAVPGLVLGSPVFPKVTINRGDGAKIEIIGESASAENCYVKSVSINGKEWNSSWINWSDLAAGGTLSFKLGNQPTAWGTDPKQVPPSFDLGKH